MNGFSELGPALQTAFPGRLTRFRTIHDNQLRFETAPEEIPQLALFLRDQFGAVLLLMVGDDLRAIAGRFEVHYLFGHPQENWFVQATVPLDAGDPALVSLATFYYPASRFEREIFDLLGIRATGHPDTRPLVRHAFWPQDFFPLRKDAVVPVFTDHGQPFPFGQVQGEGVFEIPVGPVHAGVIEPGHFRFSVVGETIIDMMSRLYYTHKGTEKLFEGRQPAEAVELAERISGDTTAGHALAFCQAVESAAGVVVPARARFLRTIFLELERLYNHIADFGAIANDTGFAMAASHCSRLRERLLAANKRLTGNRLLRGALCPGGVRCDLNPDFDLGREVKETTADFLSVVDLCLQNTILVDRLEDTGRLFTKTGLDNGVLGCVARASGIDRDVRRDHPFAAYPELQFEVPVLTQGDVKARALVRVEEVRQSTSLIRQALRAIPPGPLAVPLPPLPGFEPAFSLVEGWRGGIIHWVMVDEKGTLHRVKVLDPSFLNWHPLSYALLGNIVPDFPLCNKSFNQSYSGNDL